MGQCCHHDSERFLFEDKQEFSEGDQNNDKYWVHEIDSYQITFFMSGKVQLVRYWNCQICEYGENEKTEVKHLKYEGQYSINKDDENELEISIKLTQGRKIDEGDWHQLEDFNIKFYNFKKLNIKGFHKIAKDSIFKEGQLISHFLIYPEEEFNEKAFDYLKIGYNDIEEKVAKDALKKHNRDFDKALKELYPNINFDEKLKLLKDLLIPAKEFSHIQKTEYFLKSYLAQAKGDPALALALHNYKFSNFREMIMDKQFIEEPVTNPEEILKCYFQRYSFKIDDQYPIAGYDTGSKLNFIKRHQIYKLSYEELINYYGIVPTEQETQEIIIQRLHYYAQFCQDQLPRTVLQITNDRILAHKKKIEKLKSEGFEEKFIKSAIQEFCIDREGIVEDDHLKNAVQILSDKKLNKEFKFIYLVYRKKEIFSQSQYKESYIQKGQNPLDYLKESLKYQWEEFEQQYKNQINISFIQWALIQNKVYKVYDSIQILKQTYKKIKGNDLTEETAIEMLAETEF